MPVSSDRPQRSPWWWVATGTSVPYAAGVLGFFALRVLLPRLPALLAMVSYAAPFLFAPLAVLLPLALLSRSRPAIISTLLVLALFLALFLPRFLPRSTSSPPATGEPLRVMTLNLGVRRAPPQRLVEAIERENADLVAVQELLPATAWALRRGLGERYPHTVLEPGQSDTGLLSRYPILASERFRPAGFGRAALQARLDVDGTAVHVIVVHPRPPEFCELQGCPVPTGVCYDELDRQVVDIAARAAALPGPVLVLGDFNMSEETRAYDRMASILKDAFREAGQGFGFTFPVGRSLNGIPVPGPLIRLDYVFHSGELFASGARVGCGAGSDHCFVVAELERRFDSGPPPSPQAAALPIARTLASRAVPSLPPCVRGRSQSPATRAIASSTTSCASDLMGPGLSGSLRRQSGVRGATWSVASTMLQSVLPWNSISSATRSPLTTRCSTAGSESAIRP